MNASPNRLVEVVIPDAGPLISLALGNALHLLLVFQDQVRIVITDFVEFEVTRARGSHPDGKRISDFLTRHAGRVEIQATGLGRLMKQAYLAREKFDTDAVARATMLGLGMEPAPLPRNAGELRIVSYVNELIARPPGRPVLILAEDDFFLNPSAASPGNAHILSTRAFLDTLQSLGKVADADALWRDIQAARPSVNASQADRPAAKIRTTWVDAIVPEGGPPAVVGAVVEKSRKLKAPRP